MDERITCLSCLDCKHYDVCEKIDFEPSRKCKVKCLSPKRDKNTLLYEKKEGGIYHE